MMCGKSFWALIDRAGKEEVCIKACIRYVLFSILVLAIDEIFLRDQVVLKVTASRFPVVIMIPMLVYMFFSCMAGVYLSIAAREKYRQMLDVAKKKKTIKLTYLHALVLVAWFIALISSLHHLWPGKIHLWFFIDSIMLVYKAVYCEDLLK